jgi:hypothetical protein
MLAILLALRNFFRKTQYKKHSRVIAAAKSKPRFHRFARARTISLGANPHLQSVAVINMVTAGKRWRYANFRSENRTGAPYGQPITNKFGNNSPAFPVKHSSKDEQFAGSFGPT